MPYAALCPWLDNCGESIQSTVNPEENDGHWLLAAVYVRGHKLRNRTCYRSQTLKQKYVASAEEILKVPGARERVQIEGRSGAFLVFDVEHELKLAYVVDISHDSG